VQPLFLDPSSIMEPLLSTFYLCLVTVSFLC
jgi:hypothetical protein